jgi:hypothetical protein
VTRFANRSGGAFAVGAILAIGGCTSPSVTPSASVLPSSASPAEAGNLPPGCEELELRGPNGDLFLLDGRWVEADRTDAGRMTWWFRQLGDCVWGVGTVDDPEVVSQGSVQNLIGTVRPDFSIDAQVMPLGLRAFSGRPMSYADVQFLIEFTDDGGVILREDSDSTAVGGPRCPEPFNCLVPLVLYPAD